MIGFAYIIEAANPIAGWWDVTFEPRGFSPLVGGVPETLILRWGIVNFCTVFSFLLVFKSGIKTNWRFLFFLLPFLLTGIEGMIFISAYLPNNIAFYYYNAVVVLIFLMPFVRIPEILHIPVDVERTNDFFVFTGTAVIMIVCLYYILISGNLELSTASISLISMLIYLFIPTGRESSVILVTGVALLVLSWKAFFAFLPGVYILFALKLGKTHFRKTG